MNNLPKGKSLAELNPNLAKEWHPIRNRDLTPFDVLSSSSKKVWWNCDKGVDHEWETSVYRRSLGSGCHVCLGKKVVLSNCLATTHPELAKEWHPTKNKLTPFDVISGSNKKVWWECDKGEDHEWAAVVGSRITGVSCPICSNKKIVKSNCLATLNPKLAKQWHPIKNGHLTPFDFGIGSNKKVWWKCEKGEDHEWETHIISRNSGNGCSICNGKKVVLSNCLVTTHPELAKEWHPTKNKLSPFDLISGSNKKVWWKCNKADDHTWFTSVNHRSNGTKCPFCANQKVSKTNSLGALYPELSKEWHPTKNKYTSFDVISGSNKKFWWKCDVGEDHEWEASCSKRIYGRGCPICSNHKVVNSNCLALTHPQLLNFWSEKNIISPYEVTFGSSKKVFWDCNLGHNYLMSISDKTRGRGCAVCSSRQITTDNCLATRYPKYVKLWSSKNKLTPYDVAPMSHTKTWWKCENNLHEDYYSNIHNVTRGHGCKKCGYTKIQETKRKPQEIAENQIKLICSQEKYKFLSWIGEYKNSRSKFNYLCPQNHQHYIELNSFLVGSRCSVCAGKTVDFSNCLATLNPELAKQWHPTKNKELTANDVTVGTGKKVWWLCDKGDDHEWEAVIGSRNSGVSCPVCVGQKVVLSNCLATLNPELAKQWHPTKNKELTANDVSLGTDKKVWWQCDKGGDHEWEADVRNRNLGIGCPFCTLTPQSKQELTITFELLKIFKDINPRGFKTRINGKLWTIDIYIPQLHLGIEFDGSYWHKDKRALDKLKTQQLNEEGFDVIRVREEPLEKIFDTDVISSMPYTGKKVTDTVLRQIMKMKKIDGNKVRQINNYLTKEGLQNQKGLDEYIDLILTEKANK